MTRTRFDKIQKMYLVQRNGHDKQDIPRASNDLLKRGGAVCYRTHQGDRLSVLVFTGFKWGFRYIDEPTAKLKFIGDTARASISAADTDKNQVYVCFSKEQMLENRPNMKRKPIS